MENIVRSVTVAAEPKHVFRLISQPAYLVRLLPGEAEIDGQERLSPEGWRCHWVRKLLNVRFDGLVEVVPLAWEKGVLVRMSGGLNCTSRWTLSPQHNGTYLTVSLEYGIPSPLLQKHSSEAIRAALTGDLEHMLAQVSAAVEAAPAPSL